MPLIYITGTSGSGKSTVLKELSKQGFEAHGVDEEGFADWINRETGAIIPFPDDESSVDRHEWYKKHNWVLSRERIATLKEQAGASAKPIFLAGLADGDDVVWHLFDTVIYLAVDEATLKHRINTRKDNSFGKTPEEMEVIFKWFRENDGRYQTNGAIIVDASKPPNDVVNEIVSRVS